ncbi:M20/M25/M40 family metallo-hydrolase [Sphingomonas sp. R1]|uniref:M20/M25/M40 family metallo-hydrolase n=1 Tax=Sphingomonas sp. R1 TaxID=399176 RepID=UPI00222470FC|nr:M20/M25/M40 family metallo-hydrolase [Sphingomonas sp. R1]UYY75935.1 M20/M25/M40 family metallo-hydrolase [Sphingomonas sp. R1]
MRFAGLLALSLAIAAPVAAQQALPPPPLTAEQAALKAHVQFLASDALRGREVGTRDYEVASEYVAAQMLAIGLKPGGAGGWFQPFRLGTFRATDKPSWTLRRDGKDLPLAFGSDFVSAPTHLPDFTAQGSMVFAGYGIVDPQHGRDDYRGLDPRGKIVVLVTSTPKGLPTEVQAYVGDIRERARLAAARGAAAVLFLETPALTAQLPKGMKLEAAHDFPSMRWLGPAGTDIRQAPTMSIGLITAAGAPKLFAGSRIRLADIAAAEQRGGAMPTGALTGTLSVSGKTSFTTKETRNVLGMIEGSDPALKDQVIVLSAHLDHVGVGTAVKGDAIYNGAMDNAVGVSMLLEIAKSIQESGKRPRRTLVFVALAAEEEGLFGSAYFAHNPTVPKGSIVADVNFDMPILTYPLVDLVVLGGERSSIGQAVAAAAKAEGLGVVPDPEPQENFFVRSDHYSFVQAGIPAVSIDTGPGGTGAVAARKFLDENYHKPSDQIDLPFNWDSAVKYKHVGLSTVQALANGDARPSWNKGDFFGTLFGGAGAQ